MDCIYRNANVFQSGAFVKKDLIVSGGMISDAAVSGVAVVDADSYFVFPGFVDVHVHLREPGFLYKETIKTGTLASAHGGYTTVCSMPNLNPTPDSLETLNVQREIIERDACIRVVPYGTITVGHSLCDSDAIENILGEFSVKR